MILDPGCSMLDIRVLQILSLPRRACRQAGKGINNESSKRIRIIGLIINL